MSGHHVLPESIRKSFKTTAVLGVYTGMLLEAGGFGGIHEVLNHFYPGIMTIGCAVMGPTAQKEVLRQHPELEVLGLPTDSDWEAWLARVLPELPSELELNGPLSISDQEIGEKFKAFGERRPRG